jgi:hypothetical protein
MINRLRAILGAGFVFAALTFAANEAVAARRALALDFCTEWCEPLFETWNACAPSSGGDTNCDLCCDVCFGSGGNGGECLSYSEEEWQGCLCF